MDPHPFTPPSMHFDVHLPYVSTTLEVMLKMILKELVPANMMMMKVAINVDMDDDDNLWICV